MKSRKLTLVTIVFFVTLATPLFLTAQTTRYAVTDLGTLGGTFSLALGINDTGWVVGVSSLPDDTAFHAFLWKKDLLVDLGTLGGPNSVAGHPLNERGQIGGVAETSTPDPLGEDFCAYFDVNHLVCLPFVWQNGVARVLPTLGGSNGQAHQINNRGQVVGLAENSTLDPTCPPPGPPFFELLEFKPVLWEKDEIHELPHLRR